MAIRFLIPTLFVGVILASAPARARDPSVLLVDHSAPSVASERRQAIVAELTRALRAANVIDVRLPEAATDAAGQVLEMLQKAETLSREFKEAEALAQVKEAERAFRGTSARLTSLDPLLTVLKRRAQLEVDLDQQQALTQTLTRLAVIAPQLVLDPGRFRPDIIEQFNRARATTGQQTASLKLQTLPRGQPLWVDGRKRRNAPATIELPAGEHFVGAGEASVVGQSVKLKAGESASITVKASAAADDNRLRTMGAEAGTDWVLELALRNSGAGHRATLRLVNARTASAAREVHSDPFRIEARRAPLELLAKRVAAWLGIADDRLADASPPQQRSILRKWWFWTAVGVAVVAVGGGVTAGVLANRERGVQLRVIP